MPSFSLQRRWSDRIGCDGADYTRGAPANQLDDGIDDTFLLGPVELSTGAASCVPIESGLLGGKPHSSHLAEKSAIRRSG